jgi:hypothetical protein
MRGPPPTGFSAQLPPLRVRFPINAPRLPDVSAIAPWRDVYWAQTTAPALATFLKSTMKNFGQSRDERRPADYGGRRTFRCTKVDAARLLTPTRAHSRLSLPTSRPPTTHHERERRGDGSDRLGDGTRRSCAGFPPEGVAIMPDENLRAYPCGTAGPAAGCSPAG